MMGSQMTMACARDDVFTIQRIIHSLRTSLAILQGSQLSVTLKDL